MFTLVSMILWQAPVNTYAHIYIVFIVGIVDYTKLT